MAEAATLRGKVGGLLYLTVVGVSLLIAGLYAALVAVGIPLPRADQLWPVFPIWGGSLFLLGYLLNTRNFGLVLPGAAAVMVGVFFFPFAFGMWSWDLMERLWPVFPLIGGLAFFAMWLAAFAQACGTSRSSRHGASRPALWGLSFTLTPLSQLLTTIGWPVFVLAAGSILVLTALLTALLKSFRLLLKVS